MTIATKELREQWRALIDNPANMTSAVGEYTPAEFTSLIDNLENVLAVLLRVVNGATRTQGQFSNGADFAHIPQAVLDVGRETLAAYGVDPAKINARD